MIIESGVEIHEIGEETTGCDLTSQFIEIVISILGQITNAALLLPYLYGEKMKAYLIKGARRLPAMRDYPNPVFGDNGIIVSS